MPLTRLTGCAWPHGHARPKPPSSLPRQNGFTDGRVGRVKDTSMSFTGYTGRGSRYRGSRRRLASFRSLRIPPHPDARSADLLQSAKRPKTSAWEMSGRTDASFPLEETLIRSLDPLNTGF
ncbi:MAG: hypothetical protein WDM76_07885 [Limisphaerales bacterium]